MEAVNKTPCFSQTGRRPAPCTVVQARLLLPPRGAALRSCEEECKLQQLRQEAAARIRRARAAHVYRRLPWPGKLLCWVVGAALFAALFIGLFGLFCHWKWTFTLEIRRGAQVVKKSYNLWIWSLKDWKREWASKGAGCAVPAG